MGVIHAQINNIFVHCPQSRLAFHPGVLVTPPTDGIVSVRMELNELVVPDADARVALKGLPVSYWKQITMLKKVHTA